MNHLLLITVDGIPTIQQQQNSLQLLLSLLLQIKKIDK